MKKLIIVVLVIIMCLALTACGGVDTTPSAPNQNTTQQPTTTHQTTTTSPEIEYGASGSKFADHPYLKDIFGHWIFEKDWYNGNYKLYRSLEINEDGSCKIDGTDANWKLEDEVTSSTYLYIGIYSDSEIIYAACFIMDTNYGFCMVPMQSLWAEPDGAVFLKE